MTHKHPKLNTYLFSDIKVVRSFLVAQQVKDPVLSLQQLGLQSLLWCGLSPWPRNFHVLQVHPKKKYIYIYDKTIERAFPVACSVTTRSCLCNRSGSGLGTSTRHGYKQTNHGELGNGKLKRQNSSSFWGRRHPENLSAVVFPLNWVVGTQVFPVVSFSAPYIFYKEHIGSSRILLRPGRERVEDHSIGGGS